MFPQVQGSDIRVRFAILKGSALPHFLGSRSEDLLRGVEAESRFGGQVHSYIKISYILLNLTLTISCIEAHRDGEEARRRMEATLVALESGMTHLTRALKIEIQVNISRK